MSQPGATAPAPARYFALDGVRATAMLLGVYYHALMFGGMRGGGPGFGPPGVEGGGGSMAVQDWLHSFRMPLFFLISGFFCRMMLEKYGTRGYLARRWTRIGLPLLFGLFVIVPVYQLTRSGPGGGGGPPRGGPGGAMPAPPPGFVPPPLARFDKDGDGSLSEAEWKEARASFGGPGGPGPGFGRGPGMGPGGPPPFGARGGEIGDKVFGAASRLFRLEFLWFLWYLLVFGTIAPFLAGGVGRVVSRLPGGGDGLGRGVARFGLLPLALGLASAPLLMSTTGFGGWSLGLASGIFRGVPDFAFHLEPDMPFYASYFLTGWWVHRRRETLPDLGRLWLPCLAVGLAAHAEASALSSAYSRQTGLPNYSLLRTLGYAVYAVGGAYTAFAFLGFFLKHVDRPSRAGRYLADTAFWVYMVHLPLLGPVLAAFGGLGLPWWARGVLVASATTAVALLLFEALVRPTPLFRLFGPPPARRPEPEPVVAGGAVASVK